MWFTWANLLTLLRFLCIAPCAWAIVEDHWLIATALFTLAVATDLIDGPVARHFNHDSGLGGLLDHATDAAFVTINLAALAWIGLTSSLLPLLIPAAFIQYLLDSKVLAGESLRTSWLGKNNGIAYFVLVGVAVIRNGLDLSWPADLWIMVFSWLLVLSTLVSMLDRALAVRRTRS